jgi:cell division protein ZapB
MFDNSHAPQTFVWAKGSEYKSGTHTIEIWCEGNMMGSGTLVVR